MTEITLRIKRASVVVGASCVDKINITFDAPTTFPEMGYESSATIDARHGYGAGWCRTVLGIEPEIIDVRREGKPRHPARVQ